MMNTKPDGPFQAWVRRELLLQLSAKGKIELQKTRAHELYVRSFT
jgi:hypothetical protein